MCVCFLPCRAGLLIPVDERGLQETGRLGTEQQSRSERRWVSGWWREWRRESAESLELCEPAAPLRVGVAPLQDRHTEWAGGGALCDLNYYCSPLPPHCSVGETAKSACKPCCIPTLCIAPQLWVFSDSHQWCKEAKASTTSLDGDSCDQWGGAAKSHDENPVWTTLAYTKLKSRAALITTGSTEACTQWKTFMFSPSTSLSLSLFRCMF